MRNRDPGELEKVDVLKARRISEKRLEQGKVLNYNELQQVNADLKVALLQKEKEEKEKREEERMQTEPAKPKKITVDEFCFLDNEYVVPIAVQVSQIVLILTKYLYFF